MKISKILASATLTVAAASASVFAGVVNTFQFVGDADPAWATYGSNVGTPGANVGTNLGGSHVFTGSNGLDVTVTFFENVADDGTGGSATNGYWGHGLTVAGSTGSANRVDSNGEAILFDFGTDVAALSSFYYGWGTYNTDVGVFYNDNGSWTSIAADDFTGFHTLALGSTVSDKFLFVNIDAPSGNDTWALKGFAVETTQVPEPGSLALLSLGLIGLGVSRRRAK